MDDANRYPAYDGWGRELGMLSMKDAKAIGPAEFDGETKTITVDDDSLEDDFCPQ